MRTPQEIDELRQMMKSLGQDPSDEELKELISSVDENNDGQIQLREVKPQILRCTHTHTQQQTVQAQIGESGAQISRVPSSTDSHDHPSQLAPSLRFLRPSLPIRLLSHDSSLSPRLSIGRTP